MDALLDLPIAGAVLDMDGVLTRTRDLHERAWGLLFDAELPRLLPGTAPFAPLDYERYVDGRSREDGIRTLLTARGLAPERITAELVARLAESKQGLFEHLLASADGVPLVPGAVDLLRGLRSAGVRIAVATASRNAPAILSRAGLGALVDEVVDGNDALARGLPSKPDPAVFLEACERLGVAPAGSLLVEDSVAGVTAAAAAGFALVVGIAAHPRAAASLRAAGADATVPSPGVLEVTPDARLGRTGPSDPWVLAYTSYDPAAEGTRESLCTLANAYWGVRGAAEEARADAIHHPGTYLAGVYDTTEDGPGAVEEIVNLPNWLPLLLRVEDGGWLTADATDVVSFRQELDLRQGVLRRSLVFRDADGRETAVRFRRLVSQADTRLGAVQATVTARNWSGRLTIRSGIDVAGQEKGPPRGYVIRDSGQPSGDTLLLAVETVDSGVHVGLAVRTRVYRGDRAEPAPVQAPAPSVADGESLHQELTVELREGETVTVEKVAAVSTSRDRAIRSAPGAAQAAVDRCARFAGLLDEHGRAWERLWADFTVVLRPQSEASIPLHLNTFHLLQTLAGATADLDVGVPARGLHGEAYGGHVFWDELFVYPVLTLRRPAVSRALLAYRHRRLGAARIAAADAGRDGACFPWQSATTGEDVTPHRLFNPLTREWMADNSRLQRHVGLGVAYSAWQFYQLTGDSEYLAEEGAELIVSVARYFASLATWEETTGRFSIAGVMGPDEFHDGPPAHPGAGLTDNVYTNVMTAWVLLRAVDTARILSARPDASASDALGLSPAELERWSYIAKRLRIIFNRDGTLSQFDGYDALEPLPLDEYRERYPSIQRLDLILNAEGDSTNRYQVSKQPDSLMLLYLFSAEELRELLRHMGYPLDADVIVRTVERYSRTSTYGSTLSNVVHSWLEARGDRSRSWQFLERTLQSDMADIQAGTTRQGVHLAAMAGSVDLLTRCYAGLEARADMLWFHPLLPAELEALEFTIVYRAHRLRVAITRTTLTIASAAGFADPVRVIVEGQPVLLHTGETREFEL
ncbi:HAD-IA family hydrolase [Leifsonia xyli]|uniref:HAD-IA family hydrolase n=1 Tax=Leifsonia xyli TaxID=1575 RepID=UPI003D66F805